MFVKLDYSTQYENEIKAYNSVKYIEYLVKDDEFIKDEWDEMSEDERDEWSNYCGGDKYYYEIDDNDARKILSKPYDKMNDLDFEIYFKIVSKMGESEFDYFDKLFSNQEFMKYRKKDINPLLFLFS